MQENSNQDFFTTFEKKCDDCKNWKIHQVLSSMTAFEQNSHLTCICDLLNYGTVCCSQGFRSLLKKQLDLVTKIQSPPMLSTLSMLLRQHSSVIDEACDEVFLECKEILQSANDKYEKLCLCKSPKNDII